MPLQGVTTRIPQSPNRNKKSLASKEVVLREEPGKRHRYTERDARKV